MEHLAAALRQENDILNGCQIRGKLRLCVYDASKVRGEDDVVVAKLDLALVQTKGILKVCICLLCLVVTTDTLETKDLADASAVFNVLLKKSDGCGMNAVIGVVVGLNKLHTLVEDLVYLVHIVNVLGSVEW